MIRTRTVTSYVSAAGLALVASLLAYSCWRLGALPDLFPRFALQPATGDTIEVLTSAPIAAAVLAVYSISIGLILTRFGLRRIWSYLLLGIAVVCTMSLLVAHFLGFDLLAVPLLLNGGLTILLVQVGRLWRVDRSLTRTLFTSSNGAGQQSTDANTRLMSGLKLLNTMLPLNEAIVFQCVDSWFEAVARFKGSSQSAPDTKRNSVWREGLRLCEQAVATGQLVSETAQGRPSTVAVPLLHEREAAGALLIRLVSEFSADDKSLLEAIGSQFARNLKRESFSHNSSAVAIVRLFLAERKPAKARCAQRAEGVDCRTALRGKHAGPHRGWRCDRLSRRHARASESDSSQLRRSDAGKSTHTRSLRLVGPLPH